MFRQSLIPDTINVISLLEITIEKLQGFNMYTLFLDDLRSPTKDLENVKIARNVSQAIELVEKNGLPSVISFDHDLGEGEFTSPRFMWWLIDQHLDEKLDLNSIKKIFIHSANPVGAENLKGTWDGFSSCELTSGVLSVINTRYD